jgi:putative peptidoglycan lipid II flippase
MDQHHLEKRSILKKTFQFGAFTLLSRVMGIVRTILQVRLLGVSALSDAFIVAFRIPNALRKVFAEGALTAAFVPTFIKIIKSGDIKSGSRLMSISFLFFEGILLILTLLVMQYSEGVIHLIAYGFSGERLVYAAQYLRILFPLIFFLSSGALFAGALQAVNHFIMPSFAPVLLNVSYIGALFLCLWCGYSVDFLCWGILFGGLLQFILYLIVYMHHGFGFAKPTKHTFEHFRSILSKFLHCLFGVSVMELNLIIDGNAASFLDKGSVSVLEYGTRFMQIPLGVFAVAFSTVLLSHFSRVVLYAPKRLSVYLLEASKFVTWVILPTILFLSFTSQKLFSTLIMTRGVEEYQIWQSGWVLIIMASGLVFFSLNKILTNIFYSMGDTTSPSIAGALGTGVNLVANVVSVLYLGQAAIFGIALGTVLSGLVIMIASFYLLKGRYSFTFYFGNFFTFCGRYLGQLLLGSALFVVVYRAAMGFLETYCDSSSAALFGYMISSSWLQFFHNEWGYWLITVPLALLIFLMLFYTRKRFKLKLYFLDR